MRVIGRERERERELEKKAEEEIAAAAAAACYTNCIIIRGICDEVHRGGRGTPDYWLSQSTGEKQQQQRKVLESSSIQDCPL